MSHELNQDRRDFLKKAGLFAAAVTVPVSVWSCARKEKGNTGSEEKAAAPVANADPAWIKRVDELETSGMYTKEAPGKWKGKAGSHVPQVTFNDGQGSVSLFTDHGMSESHWITTHYLKDQNGTIIGLNEYKGTDAEARHTFSLPPGTTEVTAYSHCNKHDDWSADPAKLG